MTVPEFVERLWAFRDTGIYPASALVAPGELDDIVTTPGDSRFGITIQASSQVPQGEVWWVTKQGAVYGSTPKQPNCDSVTTLPKESETMELKLYEYRIIRKSDDTLGQHPVDPEALGGGEVWAHDEDSAERRVLYEADPHKFGDVRTMQVIIHPFC